MRIAIYHYPTLTLGEDTFVFDIVASIVKLGHDVDVITSNQLPIIGGERRITIEEAKARLGGGVLHEHAFVKVIPTPNSISSIRRIIGDCDVLYVKNEIFELIPLKVLGGTEIPTVCGIHTSVSYPYASTLRAKLHNRIYRGVFYRYLLNQCDLVHVLNSTDFNLMRTHFRIEEQRICLVPIGINVQEFKPFIIPRTNNKTQILFLGRLDEQKGFDIFYEAIVRLSAEKEFQEMSFSIVGTGRLRGLAGRLCKRYSNVSYSRFVPQASIVHIYNQQDLLVLPSRWETFSYVCLEAQSCGIPVIATCISGPLEIVDDRCTGLLVPPEDSLSLANAILYLHRLRLNDVHAYKEMKELARKKILEKYSLGVIAKEFESLLLKLANSKGRS